ncbi:IS30 family transposase, partial [Pseudalkalibacillus decolorationis]|uniref:IS30 family transposase n=1 Tax=Pseudalkalibacillus decolorationis TaxID=163879 RepID=UPI00214826D3
MAQTHSSTKARSFKHLSDSERGEISAYLKLGLSLREIAKRTNRDVSTISRERKRGSVTQLDTKARSFKHLSDSERGEISAYLKLGLSLREIAKRTNRDVSTISRERKRGSVTQLDTNRKPSINYFSDTGARVYKENRQHCGAQSIVMKAWEFLQFAGKKILEDKWSPDAIVGYAKRATTFNNTYIPSTKTIYNLIDQGKLSVRNLDLAMKMRRSTKKKPSRKNKRILGQSIEERCDSVESREEFGHWEIDTVIGKKS